jgi:holliday junction DNA helicase RuvA
MISFLEGTVEHLGDKYAILNTGGIGYRVIVSSKVLNILSKNKDKVKLFIHSQMNMRDGTFDMYGFDKKEDLDLFHLLTTVSGIGPKGAQTILAAVEPSHLKAAIVNEDPDYLRKVSSIGAKTAQRLIMELKGKVDYIATAVDAVNLGQESQATEALLTLGYNISEAKEALKEAKGDTLQERVRQALKILGKK